jgi:hypothetical protein
VSTFTTNIEIQKTYPAVQYEPDTVSEPSGVWHEDHEIDGVMYRATNATFDDVTSFKWTLEDPLQPAYCITQNTDGSTSYLYMAANTTVPWSTAEWVGTGQPVMYHAVNYGLNENDPTGGVNNTAALQSAVSAAALGGGGRVFIPAGIYQIDGTITVPPTTDGADASPPVGIVIEGCGGSTELAQQANPAVPIFSMPGGNNGYGVRLKNFQMSFANPLAGVFAVSSLADEVVCEQCIFLYCPAMSMGGGHNGLLDCRVFYDVRGTDDTENATMVSMSEANDFVTLCYIYQKSVHKGGPAGCVAIQIGSASEPRVDNTNIVDFDTGLMIVGNGGSPGRLTHGFFSNLACECNQYGAYIQPSGIGATIYELLFDGCIFERTQFATEYTVPPTGIYIDVYRSGAEVGPTDYVSDINFTNCISHDWAGPGMQINGGQDITVTGGRYGQNATDDSMTTSGAIAVTGPAVRVTVVGADCSGVIPPNPAQPPAENPQPYSISVTGAVTGVQVQACNLTNNGTGALYAPTDATDLRVIDCRGYNDQVKQLIATVPTTGTRFNGGTYGYFGPSTFYITGTAGSITAIKVSYSGDLVTPAITTGLTSGPFRLDPGEWGEIDHLGIGVITLVLVGT